jgi:hypothetical protein
MQVSQPAHDLLLVQVRHLRLHPLGPRIASIDFTAAPDAY